MALANPAASRGRVRR
uniref:Uncharacterized protein n=1 Tax=Arundo donax TaxID=35708 RepID=A0A0A8YGR5_ARUDO